MTRIFWAGICRDNVLLAEAGRDNGDGEVIKLAKKLVKKSPTGGWEYERSRKDKLRGIKFHVHEDAAQQAGQGEWERSLKRGAAGGGEGTAGDDDDANKGLIWTFCCVADSSLPEVQQKSFLEKIVHLTEPPRQEDYLWREGDKLACQEIFAPMLLQRMEQVSNMGKLAMVQMSVDDTKEIMAKNIEVILARGENLERLEKRSEELNVMAEAFHKKAKEVKRFKQWQDAKHGVVIGTAVTGVVAIVTVPPLIALL